jgi:hypothetical protein
MKRRDFLVASTGFAGLIIPPLARAQVRPCPPPVIGVDGGQSVNTACNAGDAEGDWLARSSAAGVVWFHDFRSEAEVNAFRWTGAYGGGNDPLARGGNGSHVRRNIADGVTGGGCLEIWHPNGSGGNSHWWRPFSPLTAPGNGKASNDPGASGAIAAQSYLPTDGGSQIWNWGLRGYYGHPQADAKGGTWDGNEFYLQMRVKMDPRRTTSGNNQVGKLTFLSTTRASNTAQEIVTYSGAFQTEGVGQPNYFRMYSRGYSPIESWDSLGRPGQQLGKDGSNYSGGPFCHVRNESGGTANFCWAWSGGWDTIMYHIKPGQGGVENQRVVVYAAREGQKTFTKIWDEIYAIYHSNDSQIAEGYNALICSIYQNGSENSEFWHRYDQVIFSKQFIPCPQV